ncbi:MAG: homoserine dehydrogenase [Eubacterium sp.]|jgi:homoserine dehydrogenase|nr:homoserine dehydrogenase [Eubacterium sp.]
MSKIAVLGYGVVGSGTVEVFYKNKKNLEQRAGRDLDIKYILDLRDFNDSPYADRFVKDFEVILKDPEVEVVAELIGGATFSYDFVKQSLLAGKSVVTSNKELVAQKGAELLKIAAEKGVSFFFEASVGGGIPLIRPLHQCLPTDVVTEIKGILNGTTNFILSKMFAEGMNFGDALKMAQDFGYAERNPEADVEGHDTCRKICILASLCFGRHIFPAHVHTEGITNITLPDMEYADNFKCAVKLIGWAKKEKGKLIVMVFPAFIPSDCQLSTVNDVFNAVLVHGEARGEVLFYGKGAGKLPTASAVLSDIVNALKDNVEKSMFWEESCENENPILNYKDMTHRFYVRLKSAQAADIFKVFGNEGIEFIHRKNALEEEKAFITDYLTEREFDEKCADIEKAAEIIGKLRVFE